VVFCVPTESALFDFAFFVAAKRHSQVLQQVNCVWGLFCEGFDGVLVGEVVAAFYRVVAMPFGLVAFFVAKRRGYSTLCCD
jgi:hypothetical protein